MLLVPICSMYGIFTYFWVIFRANVGKYCIHGAYGVIPVIQPFFKPGPFSFSIDFSPRLLMLSWVLLSGLALGSTSFISMSPGQLIVGPEVVTW